MEHILFELSIAVVGALAALLALGVKKLMNSKKFSAYITDQELLAILFEAAITEVGRKYPNLSADNYEITLKLFLHKEVHKYFGYSLNDKQLDQLFLAARESLAKQLKG